MFVDLAAVITIGRQAGVISQGRTQEEPEKRLGALLLAGAPVVAIDDDAPLGGDFPCGTSAVADETEWPALYQHRRGFDRRARAALGTRSSSGR